MARRAQLPLLLKPMYEGGWVIRSPLLPELVVLARSVNEIDRKTREAVNSMKELYFHLGKEFPLLPLATASLAYSYDHMVEI